MLKRPPKREQDEGLLDRLGAVVGPKGLIRDPVEMEPYLVEPRGLFRGAGRCVVKPASTQEVAEAVRPPR